MDLAQLSGVLPTATDWQRFEGNVCAVFCDQGLLSDTAMPRVMEGDRIYDHRLDPLEHAIERVRLGRTPIAFPDFQAVLTRGLLPRQVSAMGLDCQPDISKYIERVVEGLLAAAVYCYQPTQGGDRIVLSRNYVLMPVDLLNLAHKLLGREQNLERKNSVYEAVHLAFALYYSTPRAEDESGYLCVDLKPGYENPPSLPILKPSKEY